MTTARGRWFWTVGLALLSVLVGTVLVVASVRARARNKGAAADLDEEDATPTVKVITPRYDPAFVLTVQQLATVEPFFKAEIRSQVTGTVKDIVKNLNDTVAKDELLILLDVPHLTEEVAQKDAVIAQRAQEL